MKGYRSLFRVIQNQKMSKESEPEAGSSCSIFSFFLPAFGAARAYYVITYFLGSSNRCLHGAYNYV